MRLRRERRPRLPRHSSLCWLHRVAPSEHLLLASMRAWIRHGQAYSGRGPEWNKEEEREVRDGHPLTEEECHLLTKTMKQAASSCARGRARGLFKTLAAIQALVPAMSGTSGREVHRLPSDDPEKLSAAAGWRRVPPPSHY